ncbi:hypothetical protein BV25DRAFT_1821992 [Artomyces pyxidatus]|uniref:Uncharacterized protein n=1 Tax=Artomyces pyxidatus TaxID=48021 RepID=A0ACB8T9R3_9AGAM|nr:hypothetical protein BV25DRAFT_1821992 [Artomyces pyxidatus]
MVRLTATLAVMLAAVATASALPTSAGSGLFTIAKRQSDSSGHSQPIGGSNSQPIGSSNNQPTGGENRMPCPAWLWCPDRRSA